MLWHNGGPRLTGRRRLGEDGAGTSLSLLLGATAALALLAAQPAARAADSGITVDPSALDAPAAAAAPSRQLLPPPERRPQSRLLVPAPMAAMGEPVAPAPRPRARPPAPAPQMSTMEPPPAPTPEPALTPPPAPPPAEPEVAAAPALEPEPEPAMPEAPAIEPTPPAATTEAPAPVETPAPAPEPAPAETATAQPEPAPAPAPAATPEEAAAPQTAALPPAATAPAGQVRIVFPEGATEVPADAIPELDALAEKLMGDEGARIQLLAYASGGPDAASKARRISLSRALAVRSYLIGKGVRSTRMDVRALGNTVPGDPADRVDIIPQS